MFRDNNVIKVPPTDRYVLVLPAMLSLPAVDSESTEGESVEAEPLSLKESLQVRHPGALVWRPARLDVR